MCNAYRIPAKKAADDFAAQVHEVAGTLPTTLVCKTDSAPVLLAAGQVELMRWGFCRSFNPSINNARMEKLDSVTWHEAFASRRCVIPMALFYEWGQIAGSNRKQAHEISTGGWMWAAGIWEEHPELGRTFSMITRPSNAYLATLHHRMPALLPQESIGRFLDQPDLEPLSSFHGTLHIQPCESPLAAKPTDPEQPELW